MSPQLNNVAQHFVFLDRTSGTMAAPSEDQLVAGMKMAQQEMDYRVDLFNRCE